MKGERFRYVVGSYYKHFMTVLLELETLVMDLKRLSCDVDIVLGIFRSDMVVVCSLLPVVKQLVLVIERFEKRPLDYAMMESLERQLIHGSSKLKAMLRESNALIGSLHGGNLTIVRFLVQRHDQALKHLTMDPLLEQVHPSPSIPLDITNFTDAITAESHKLCMAIIDILTNLLMNVHESV